MLRRLVAVFTLALVAPLLSGTLAGAHVDRAHAPRRASVTASTSTTTVAPNHPTEGLPGTTLEAESREDDTSPAPWLIGSAIAAAATIAIGGSLLKRRTGSPGALGRHDRSA